MSNEPPRKKHATVPGYGEKMSPLPPMEVREVGAFHDDMTTLDPVHGSPEVVGNVRMMVEPGAQPPPPVVDPNVSSKRTGTPAVDIDLVYERRSAPLPDQPWVFLEIWTRNTIYQLDGRLMCVDVIDQASRRSHGEHPLKGARLVGGQWRDGDTMELSHPFPRPGSEAVFEQTSGRHVRFSQTSTVTRVVMRLRVLSVTPEQLLPTWEEVTGSHKVVKKK